MSWAKDARWSWPSITPKNWLATLSLRYPIAIISKASLSLQHGFIEQKLSTSLFWSLPQCHLPKKRFFSSDSSLDITHSIFQPPIRFMLPLTGLSRYISIFPSLSFAVKRARVTSRHLSCGGSNLMGLKPVSPYQDRSIAGQPLASMESLFLEG